MNRLDLAFGITTRQSIPADHGYALYGAVSRLFSEVHQKNCIAIHPIRGRQMGDRMLALMPWSKLTFRVQDGHLAPLLILAGKSLRIGETPIRVGVPEVRALTPATALRSRLVVIKVAHIDPASAVDHPQFLVAVRSQLDRLGIAAAAQVSIPITRAGEPRRRTLRIKRREIVGYEVLVEGLTAVESLTLQEQGLGGRHHMGCGIFVPHREKVGAHGS